MNSTRIWTKLGKPRSFVNYLTTARGNRAGALLLSTDWVHAWLTPFCVSFWVNGHHHRVLNHRSISLFLSHTSRLSLIHLVFFLSLSMVKTASALTGFNITHSTAYKIFIYQMEKLGEYLSEDEMAIFPFKFIFPPWFGLCIIRLTASVLRQRIRSASRNAASYIPDKYISVTEIKK